MVIAMSVGILCVKCKSKSVSSGKTREMQSDHMIASRQGMSESDYKKLAEKAWAGDAESAYTIYRELTYGEGDYEAAYYWCLVANRLGHPRARQRDLEIAEKNIVSEVSSIDMEVDEETPRTIRQAQGQKKKQSTHPRHTHRGKSK